MPDKFGTAVRIARIVDAVDANVDGARADGFGIAERIAQEDQIPCGHVGHGNRRARNVALGHSDAVVRQGRTADRFHVRLDDQMTFHFVKSCNLLRAFQFDAVALMIVKTDGIKFFPLLLCDGHAGRRIKSARKQHYRLFHSRFLLPQPRIA